MSGQNELSLCTHQVSKFRQFLYQILINVYNCDEFLVCISYRLLIRIAKHTCSYENTSEYVITSYHDVNGLPGLKSTNGSIHLEFYAFAKRDLHVFFTEKKEFNAEDTFIIVGK